MKRWKSLKYRNTFLKEKNFFFSLNGDRTWNGKVGDEGLVSCGTVETSSVGHQSRFFDTRVCMSMVLRDFCQCLRLKNSDYLHLILAHVGMNPDKIPRGDKPLLNNTLLWANTPCPNRPFVFLTVPELKDLYHKKKGCPP